MFHNVLLILSGLILAASALATVPGVGKGLAKAGKALAGVGVVIGVVDLVVGVVGLAGVM